MFTEYLLKNLPTGEPGTGTFSTWFSSSWKNYLNDYEKDPASFDKSFQTFKLTVYSDGKRSSIYLPEPSTFVLLGSGGLGILYLFGRANK